ncbi:hypothetical protein WJX82_003790 [Trebouxia sp. C0006]
MSQQLRFAQEGKSASQAASRQAEAELQQAAESLKRRKVQVEQLQQQLHHAPAAVGISVEPARPLGSHQSSRRNSISTDQQAGVQEEEEEEGPIGAIVDKLWKDLQIERAARQLVEERLQAVETEAISHQESLSEPYMRPDQTLEGAESLMGPPGLDSTLAESHSDIVSGLSRPHQSDDGHIESLSQIALRRLSQQGAESSSPSVSGTQQIHTHTPASRGRTLETALMRIGSMDPGSGPFGAALAAAERASITPKHKISRSLSQEEGSGWSGVSPSKASWTTLLKWGSRQLPFAKRESDPEIQPDQSEQITELLRIIEHQSNHLEQYRAVLDTQRESNINLNADCERIQARLDLLGRRSRRTTSSDG